MKTERRIAGWWVVSALCALVAIGCGGGGKAKTDGGGGTGGEPKDARTDMAVDTAKTDSGTDGDAGSGCGAGDAKRGAGEACECGGQCGSGFCAEGVCCDSACGEACKTCKAVDHVGTCVSRSAGAPPRVASACLASKPDTCGLDGTCDGAGGCRKYGNNTQCAAGSCAGDQVVGGFACNGAGQCKPGATKICAPFSCSTTSGMCYPQCTNDSQCVSGHKCVDGSCGPKMNGAACSGDGECASKHCSDGVCCNVACNGACNSCNLNQREGTCWPIDRGVPDPRGRCKDDGAATCGTNGTCDGLGACAKYARDTICLMPSCSGSRLNTAGTCNGLGTCRPPGVQDCPPFRCVNGACTTACESDADCGDGIACVAKTCGPKQNGQLCKAAGECKSNQCVDGVCCESSCTGGCRTCNNPTTPGKCVAIAAGNDDTRNVCLNMGAASCGTNGKCDGSGGCQRYAAGTVCAEEKCEVKVYTPTSTCNATGQCVTPDQQPCNPYLCNGTKCFAACTVNTQCQEPNSCQVNSCGKKPDGASCSAAEECMHNVCAQGICCATACGGPCRSCALTGSLGTCTNVATGVPDPAEMCGPDAASSCGRNGKCEGGACQRYGAGTACRDPLCPAGSTLFTGVSGCDGAGTCVTPGATSCFPYLCGNAACKGTCMADGDCASPAVCINGSCGLKPIGAVCIDGKECLSNVCEQGVCCSTSCAGTCKSCALPNARGTCTNVPTGDTDPHGTCANMGPASCKTDGFCDGSGACRLYDASTSCAAPSCANAPTPTLTSGRTCDGRGTCQAASQIACAPYVCSGSTACKAACTGDGDCQPGNICDPVTSRCGNQARLGQACTNTANCLTGNTCVDGVCCSTTSCPLCQACNIAGTAGNCANVPINTPEPHTLCAANPPCGNTGACNGLGACQQAGTGVSCGTASCTGSTFTPISHCNGSGACAAPTATACSPYVCGTGACKTTCTIDGDCLAPYTCQGSGSNKSCALKPNGLACSAANQCISGNCTNSVCCGSASCPTCQACDVNGLGSCAPLANGTPAPSNQCPISTTCGNTGSCNGAGGCQQQVSTLQCAAPSCTGSTYTAPGLCTGSGGCGAQTMSSCSPYICGGTACKTNCNSNADCLNSTYFCTGSGGSCQPKRGNGATCGSGNECTSGSCTDGVCCGSAGCPTCQACNIASNPGTCTNIAAGAGDLHGGCPAGTTCGNTGVCNGAGACQQAAATVPCGTASCTGSTYTGPVTCSGSGSCPTQTQSSCSPYLCGTNACKTSCNSNSDCISSAYYCTGVGGTCVPRKGNGATCGGTNECTSDSCVDGVCCGSASCPTCQVCNLSGNGTCSNVGVIAEPHARCAPSSTCGNTGLCNGGGACQQAATTVQCGNALCNGTAFTPAAFCNGSGSCSPPGTVACTPFVCGTGNACLATCNNDNDCASGYFCPSAGAQCQAKKGPGGSCTLGHECGTNSCIDNVCCTSNGCDPCQVCNLSGNGTCTALPNGPAPDGQCTAAGTCGDTGLCQGGVCQKEPSSTACVAASCTNAGATSTFQPAATCNGGGSCSSPPAAQGCGAYTCTGAGCRSTCGGDGDCVTGYYCNGGSCQLRVANGDSCTGGNQCVSGQCIEGVCCNVACGACGSCVLPTKVGTCTPLGPGTEDTRCHDDGAESCGFNGKCDGGGNCDRYPAGTVCGRACATDGSTYTISVCDSASLCSPLLSAPCLLLTCDTLLGCLL